MTGWRPYAPYDAPGVTGKRGGSAPYLIAAAAAATASFGVL